MGKRFLRTESVTLVTFLSFVESNTVGWLPGLQGMFSGMDTPGAVIRRVTTAGNALYTLPMKLAWSFDISLIKYL